MKRRLRPPSRCHHHFILLFFKLFDIIVVIVVIDVVAVDCEPGAQTDADVEAVEERDVLSVHEDDERFLHAGIQVHRLLHGLSRQVHPAGNQFRSGIY